MQPPKEFALLGLSIQSLATGIGVKIEAFASGFVESRKRHRHQIR